MRPVIYESGRGSTTLDPYHISRPTKYTKHYEYNTTATRTQKVSVYSMYSTRLRVVH